MYELTAWLRVDGDTVYLVKNLLTQRVKVLFCNILWKMFLKSCVWNSSKKKKQTYVKCHLQV